jgi:hypothetical protein
MKALFAVALVVGLSPLSAFASNCSMQNSSTPLTQSAPDEELHWRSASPAGTCLAVREKKAPAAESAPAATKPAASGGGSYRFNMSQNGKRMTADEFDAWMKANGIRIAGSNGPVKEEKPAEPAPSEKKKKKK